MKTTEQVHISKIGIGDTIIHDNHERTVCKSNIIHDSFMGTSLFGDSYNLGYKFVTRIKYKS